MYKKVIHKLSAVLFILYFSLFPTLSVFAQTIDTTTVSTSPAIATSSQEEKIVVEDDKALPPVNYSALMRSVRSITEGKADALSHRDETIIGLERFIKREKQQLDDLNVPWGKQRAYLSRLKLQLKSIDTRPPSFFDKISSFVADLFGADDEVQRPLPQSDFKLPSNPARFRFNNETIKVNSFTKGSLTPQPGQVIPKALKKLITIPEVGAIDDPFLPVIEDVGADNQEIVLSSEITELAASLNNNPVEIINFIRNRITYEPYYGAKKGAAGCLREQTCNDVDASSLTIALMRASGIPARYQKSVAIFTVQQLQNLLGVEETKTVYGTFAWNKVPVSAMSGNHVAENLDDADLSQETHLGLEWTHPEIFYDYDERGGNIDNTLSLSSIQNTDELRTLLRPYSKKQWIPIDPIIKSYTHTERPVLVDRAQFDTQAFWTNYLSYQGPLSPTEKYSADLLQATGQRVENNLSTKSSLPDTLPILPITLPYAVGDGMVGDRQVLQESFSTLPDSSRTAVRLSLIKDADGEVVFQKTLFGPDINNVGLSLYYEGLTDIDKAVIEANGGIHATPAELVDIVPYLVSDTARYEGVNDVNNRPSVRIGDQLVMRFELLVRGEVIETNEKFSVAGNHEGIYVTLSKVLPDPLLDSPSKILLQGNAALAREYLKRVEEQTVTMAESMDYDYNLHFIRAVVTQNRILNHVNGVPTTFDFKGLTVDAAAHIAADYSNRGDYKAHRKDFRLLLGLEASDFEARLFEDIAGLESISTVNGLQYAFAHPNDYTVHTITRANENQIDNLNLSPNTKANMHADVQAGNTVTTPDRPVENGAFRGVLYISLDPVWTGTYAIGEQTGANGGWTVAQVLQRVYIDQNQQQRDGFLRQAGGSNFYFEDNRDTDSVKCRITDAEYNVVTGRPDWSAVYGYPCMIGATAFGAVDHSYILTSNGAYFLSPQLGYDYWVNKAVVNQKIDQYIASQRALPNGDLNKLEGGEKFTKRFSLILGTYVQSICENDGWWDCGDFATVYYVPGQDNGVVYRARAGILSKLGEDDNQVVAALGFPQSDERRAADSQNIQGGVYQNFVNGQVYAYTSWGLNWVYYTYGRLTEVHNNDGGTAGALGFPKGDPRSANGFTYQEFENEKEIEWNRVNEQARVVAFVKYRCELHRGIHDPFRLGVISAHGIFDTGLQTLDDLGSMIGGAISKIFHPIRSTQELVDLATATRQIRPNDVKEFLSTTGNALHTALINEYDNSFGLNGCEARSSYLVGRMTGEVLLIYVPASKLKAVEKVKALSQASKSKLGIKTVGFISKWLEYSSDVLRYIDDVPDIKKARFYFEKGHTRIKHILLGDFKGKDFIDGLHSARTLKNGMENGVLEVWSFDRTVKYRKFSDIPVEPNGVRRVMILNKDNELIFKSIFPEEWSDGDIIDAVVEAADAGQAINVTKRGKTVQVKSKVMDNLIRTGHPN